MRLAIVLALLVAGCGGAVTSPPPAATTSAAVDASPAPATASTRPTPSPRLADTDPHLCEIALRTSDYFGHVLLSMGDAIGDEALMDRTVNEATDLAEQFAASYADEPNLTIVEWVKKLRAVRAAKLAHLTGDDVPFINAVGAAAGARAAIEVACTL